MLQMLLLLLLILVQQQLLVEIPLLPRPFETCVQKVQYNTATIVAEIRSYCKENIIVLNVVLVGGL